ncbi:hypothetical protein [Rhodococcus triatomae]|uniref:hypothetical protein n=1 Tax=Rhodococcus triatomae TaxID=300028 RepID=UPI001FEBA6E0|nr:hypothetical protein [Rhodococcus triatomae]
MTRRTPSIPAPTSTASARRARIQSASTTTADATHIASVPPVCVNTVTASTSHAERA